MRKDVVRKYFGFSPQVVLFVFSSLFCCCNVHYYLDLYYCGYASNVLCFILNVSKIHKRSEVDGKMHSGVAEVTLERLS